MKVIYKYRDWSKEFHRRMITDRELYLASPKDFNDPFDCRITQNFELLKSDKDISEYVKKLGVTNETGKKDKITLKQNISPSLSTLATAIERL